MVLKGVILDNFCLGGCGDLTSNFLSVFTLGGCDGLESTDFQQFSLWMGLVVLTGLINFDFLLGESVVVLKGLIFNNFCF